MAHSTAFLKTYYYDVIQWQIRAYIHHIRKGNYPQQHWKDSLCEALKNRNNHVLAIKNNVENVQLKLF